MSQTILVEAYYVPSSSVILLIPQYFIQEQSKGNTQESFTVKTEGCVFTFGSGKTITFNCNDKTRLPIVIAYPVKRDPMSFQR